MATGDFPKEMVTALTAGANLADLVAMMMDMETIGRLAESAGLEHLLRDEATPNGARWPSFLQGRTATCHPITHIGYGHFSEV